MKKLAVSIFAIALMASFNAQAQEKSQYLSGLWSTNVGMNLFGCDFDNFDEGELNLKVRRFLNDNAALRLSLDFGYLNKKNTNYDDKESPLIDKDKDSYSGVYHDKTESIDRECNFMIAVGYEYHKIFFDRIDLFAGGDLGYRGEFYSATSKTNHESESQTVTTGSFSRSETSSTTTTEYYKRSIGGSSNNSHSFFIRGLAGVDVYFYKNLYVGTELGVYYGIQMSKDGYYERDIESTKKTFSGPSKGNITSTTETKTTTEYSSETGVTKTTTDGTTTSSYAYPGNRDEYISHSIGLFIEPSFHIGIRF